MITFICCCRHRLNALLFIPASASRYQLCVIAGVLPPFVIDAAAMLRNHPRRRPRLKDTLVLYSIVTNEFSRVGWHTGSLPLLIPLRLLETSTQHVLAPWLPSPATQAAQIAQRIEVREKKHVVDTQR